MNVIESYMSTLNNTKPHAYTSHILSTKKLLSTNALFDDLNHNGKEAVGAEYKLVEYETG